MKNSDVIYCTYDRPHAMIGISRQLNTADAFNCPLKNRAMMQIG